MFKIRDKQTGLFSKGGTYPDWNKNGKTWSGRGPVILSLLGYSGNVPIDNIEVVEYERVEKLTYRAIDLIHSSEERQRVKKEKAIERGKKWQRERDEKAYEELRVRLGK